MSRILALHNSHNASICEIENNKIIYFQEAERLDKCKKSLNWKILLEKYKNQNFDKIIFVKSRTKEEEEEKDTVEDYIKKHCNINYNKFTFEINHHFYHACSSFFNSGFKNSFVLVIDGDGAGKTIEENKFNAAEIVSLYYFNENKFKKIFKVFQYEKEFIDNKDIYINTLSLGHFYTIIKEILNFREEGSVMARASYFKGTTNLNFFTEKFNHFCSLQSVLYINMINSFFKRNPEITCKMIQTELERVVLKYVSNIIKNKKRNLCVSGGVFQNTVLNSKILDVCPDLYVDPFADDSGISMGAALWDLNKKQFIKNKIKTLNLGDHPDYKSLSLEKGISITPADVAKIISEKNIVAIFQGRNELGKRALGNRSFLYDPRDQYAKERINLLKNREWFRPTAGTILHEHAKEWFDLKSKKETPFMSYVFNVKKQSIPGITHVDNTCRIQTLKRKENFHYYNLINEFYKLTDVPILLNTSFNLAGEPLVNDVYDAIKTLTNCDDKFKFIYFPEIGKLYETNDFI